MTSEEVTGQSVGGARGAPVRALRHSGGQLLRLYRARALRSGLVPHLAFFALPVGRRVGRFQLEGRPFVARGIDWVSVEEVALRREYEVVRPLVTGPRPVVVDVGANIGMFSLYVFLLNPDAVVHAFEPSADTFDLLRRNRRANPKLAWSCYQAAVHARDGLVRVDDRPASTARRVTRAVGDQVTALSLRTLLRRYVGTGVRLLKIDVEGSEEAILVGNEDLLAEVDHLVVGLHPGACRTERVIDTIRRAFPAVYTVPGRASKKPLVLATRAWLDLPPL